MPRTLPLSSRGTCGPQHVLACSDSALGSVFWEFSGSFKGIYKGSFKGIYKGSFKGIYKGSFKGIYKGLGLIGLREFRPTQSARS